MARTKKVKVKFDFFKVNLEGSEFKLLRLLDEFLPSERTIKHHDNYFRVEEFRKDPDNTFRIGIITKIVMDDLPSKARIDRPGIEPLNLSSQEGIANLTVFLYAPKFQTVILQKTRQGVSPGALLHILDELAGIGDIELLPIIERDTLKKLEKMTLIRNFKVKVANPLEEKFYRDVPAKPIADLVSHYNSRYVTLQFSMGQAKGSMLVGNVIKSIKEFMKIRNSGQEHQIETLVVSGKGFDDEKVTLLDLLKDRKIFETEVPLLGRELSRDGLISAIIRAYNENQEEIKNYMPL